MNNTLSKADIKFIDKMIYQVNNYDQKTIDLFFTKVNNTIKKITDEELNSFFKFYIMNIKDSISKSTDKEAIRLVKKAERKSKIAKYKKGFTILYENISSRLYPSDKAVIKTIAELSFAYLLFTIFMVYLGAPAMIGNKIISIMMMSVGAYSVSRLFCLSGKEEDIKFCNKVRMISMTFLKIAFYIGLGEFAMKYIFLKSIVDVITTFLTLGKKIASLVFKA